MNPLDFLGVPDMFFWIIMAMLILMSAVQFYNLISHKLSKKCRNCGNHAGKQILCDACYDKNKDIFPKDWENKK